MKALLGTAQIIKLITGSAGTITVTSTSVDKTGTGPASYSFAVTKPANILISTATTTTLLAGAASTERNVQELTISNDHATNSNAVTVYDTDGTQIVNIFAAVLLASEKLVYDETGKWTLYGADGAEKPATLPTFQQLPAAAATPSAADTDTLKLFAQKIAGRMTLRYIGPTGVDETIQDKLSTNGFSMYLPNNGTTVGLNEGVLWTSGGTVSHPTPSSTSPAIYNQQKKTRWANVVTTTNQVLGVRTLTADKRYWRGNAAGLGGFNFHARFAVGLWPAATVRLFVGLNDSNVGWVISDTLTGNGCGLWHDTTEAATVLNFVTRDGTTATKAAITLATALAAGQCFDFNMWMAPNGGSIGYRLIEQNTGTVLADTSTSTTVPLTTAFLGQELAMSNGTANTTVTTTAFELSAHSCQSDN